MKLEECIAFSGKKSPKRHYIFVCLMVAEIISKESEDLFEKNQIIILYPAHIVVERVK